MTVEHDDSDQLLINAGEGTLTVVPLRCGDARITVDELTIGAALVRLDRDDAVALRDWINAALTSGAIR